MNLDDPKLTAYALDELDEAERQAIAREINASPEAQHEIQETQTMARRLRAEFAAELEHRQDADATTRPLSANLSDIRDDPWFWMIARPLAVAASLVVLAIIGALALYKSGNGTARSSRLDRTEFEVEATAQNQSASEFAGPDSIANPLSAQIVKRIERIVIGELDSDPQLEIGEIRVIETINDTYRVDHLKQRLGIPVVSKKLLGGSTGRRYGLMFLDRSGRVVACAQFYRAPDLGFVLQPVKNAYEQAGRYFIGSETPLPGDWQADVDYRAYVIQFPDWGECVGYAPSA
jgi:hypothetical protein